MLCFLRYPEHPSSCLISCSFTFPDFYLATWEQLQSPETASWRESHSKMLMLNLSVFKRENIIHFFFVLLTIAL